MSDFFLLLYLAKHNLSQRLSSSFSQYYSSYQVVEVAFILLFMCVDALNRGLGTFLCIVKVIYKFQWTINVFSVLWSHWSSESWYSQKSKGLCKHHHCLVPEHFCHPQKKSSTYQQPLPIYALAFGNHVSFCLHGFTYLDISYE